MALTLFAGQVRHVNREISTKAISLLVQVYGHYNSEDPTILHQTEARLVNVWISRGSALAREIGVRDRLILPAMGISEKGRPMKGGEMVFSLTKLETGRILIVNPQAVQELAVTKSDYSRVMLGASEGILSQAFKLARSVVRSLV